MIWIILLAIIILWYLGGWDKAGWSGFRDVLVPIILGIATAYYLKADIVYKGLIGFFTIGTANIIRMGYGNYDPDDDKLSHLARLWASLGVKDTQGAIIRATWGFIVGLILPLLIGVYTHNWLGWGLYIFVNTLMGYLVSKLQLPVLLADICVAIGIWSIIPLLLL